MRAYYFKKLYTLRHFNLLNNLQKTALRSIPACETLEISVGIQTNKETKALYIVSCAQKEKGNRPEFQCGHFGAFCLFVPIGIC
jgi:hypothetical protein